MSCERGCELCLSVNPEAWQLILDDIEAKFSNTHKKPFYLNKGDPLYQAVCDLVPWEITRIQAAWTPQARRLPQEFPYTRRGAALRLTTTTTLSLKLRTWAPSATPSSAFCEPFGQLCSSMESPGRLQNLR